MKPTSSRNGTAHSFSENQFNERDYLKTELVINETHLLMTKFIRHTGGDLLASSLLQQIIDCLRSTHESEDPEDRDRLRQNGMYIPFDFSRHERLFKIPKRKQQLALCRLQHTGIIDKGRSKGDTWVRVNSDMIREINVNYLKIDDPPPDPTDAEILLQSLLEQKKITTTDLVLMQVIDANSDGMKNCRLTNQQISKLVGGVTPDHTRKMLKKLEEQGLISRDGQGKERVLSLLYTPGKGGK